MSITFPNESPEYRAARNRLLAEEVALRRAMEAIAVARRGLPPGGLISEDYLFGAIAPDSPPTKIQFSELFAPGKNTLVAYHFMFPRHPGDDRPGPTLGTTAALPLQDGPCPSCTAFLDQLDGAAPHLEQKVNFVVVAKAPIDRVAVFARDRGWKHLRLLSAAHNTFKRDYHGEDANGSQMPNMSIFHRESNGEIRHTWSSELLYEPTDPGQDPRHIGTLELLWNIFDLTPEGRPENWHEQMQYDCCLWKQPVVDAEPHPTFESLRLPLPCKLQDILHVWSRALYLQGPKRPSARSAFMVTNRASELAVSELPVGRILGESLVGVNTGPGALNLMHLGLFHGGEASNAFLLLAQLGGYVLMFIAGLETDIDRMREASLTAFLVALSGVIWPFFLGAGAGHALGLPWSVPSFSVEP